MVLEQARVFDSVADAVADCAHVYATTVRKRGVTKPVVTPEEAARDDPRRSPAARRSCSARSVRGWKPTTSRSRAAIITVPINPEFGSLNLAQAVILVAYEWSKHVALAQPARDRPAARRRRRTSSTA